MKVAIDVMRSEAQSNLSIADLSEDAAQMANKLAAKFSSWKTCKITLTGFLLGRAADISFGTGAFARSRPPAGDCLQLPAQRESALRAIARSPNGLVRRGARFPASRSNPNK